ncbi:MAG TPA: hypothetical protein DCE42_14680 [Myxococcales bacterium]|nr:hypothetical protein [Deltaproteobacteria bacterium]HAA56007.1 hypothetical protein [Myxococcales bacterium]|tara:strand:+ start:538 stop:1611 length:1074 start_codon:yes stop_codon:yes gene_type:complete
MQRHRILAFDGGPSTASSLRYLREIEKAVPGFLAKTYAFAGTSDGAFVALYLANQHITPENGLQIIEDCIAFDNEVFRTFQPGVGGLAKLFSGLRPADSSSRLKKCLEKGYGANTTLGDCQRKVVAVSYRLRAPMGPTIHCNFGENAENDATLVDVAIKSSALPLTMPIYQGHVDGGIFANNPSMCAIAQTLSHMRRQGQEALIDKICMLSLGGRQTELSGKRQRKILENTHVHWGWIDWLLQARNPLFLLTLLFNSGEGGVTYQCKSLLEDDFLRVAPDGEQEFMWEIIDVLLSRVDKVFNNAEKAAEKWRANTELDNPNYQPAFEPTIEWIQQKWMIDQPAPVTMHLSDPQPLQA